jgi:flagellar FliJ protein
LRRFSFNLEKVLELRKHRERETEIALGRAVGALRIIEDRLAVLGEGISAARAEQFLPGHSLGIIQNYNRYILRLENDRDELLKEAARAEAKVEEARQIYLEASRDRKALDNLKDLRRGEYRRERFAQETKTLDDLSGGREARRIAAG